MKCRSLCVGLTTEFIGVTRHSNMCNISWFNSADTDTLKSLYWFLCNCDTVLWRPNLTSVSPFPFFPFIFPFFSFFFPFLALSSFDFFFFSLSSSLAANSAATFKTLCKHYWNKILFCIWKEQYQEAVYIWNEIIFLSKSTVLGL